MNDTTKETDATQEGQSIREVETTLAMLDRHVDLEASSRYSGAIVRRRVVQSGQDLLRMVMVYCLMPLSIRQVGAWSTLKGWGSLSKSGMRKRLRQCQRWIGVLLTQVLLAGKVSLVYREKMRLRLLDASCVSQVGSQKADWRLHLSYDLSQHRIDEIQLSTGKVGETLTHWQFQPGDVCLADRAYGVARSLGVVMGSQAHFVIRIGWQNLPLEDREGQPFLLCSWLRVQFEDPAAAPAQAFVWVKTPQGRFPIRLIARPLPPPAAAQARRRVQAEAKRRKRRLDERSLLAAGFVLLTSNLPNDHWTPLDILALYRFRWQIELVFKQLKSLLSFDLLRATDPQLAQVYLLTKILIALLLGEAAWQLALQTTDWCEDTDHPLSLWCVTQLLFEALRSSVCGIVTLQMILDHKDALKRYLTDAPRHRLRQLFPPELFQGDHAF
jgi:hypothetical protein